MVSKFDLFFCYIEIGIYKKDKNVEQENIDPNIPWSEALTNKWDKFLLLCYIYRVDSHSFAWMDHFRYNYKKS